MEQERDGAGCAEIEEEPLGRSTGKEISQPGGSRGTKQERGPSLFSLAFIRQNATTPSITVFSRCIDISWRDVVYNGVLFDKNTKKFWVDQKLHKNCLMVFPEAMSIAGAEDKRHWRWINHKVKCFGNEVHVSIPELVEVRWLDVAGKVRTTGLSPNTRYEVSLVVKLGADCDSWGVRLNTSVSLPDGSRFGNPQNLAKKPKGSWMELVAGEFVTDSKNYFGEIGYSFHEKSSNPKSGGLTVKGLLFKPKE